MRLGTVLVVSLLVSVSCGPDVPKKAPQSCEEFLAKHDASDTTPLPPGCKRSRPSATAHAKNTPAAVNTIEPTPVSITPPTGTPVDVDPLLLIPQVLDGFGPASSSVLPSKVGCGATASYRDSNGHLTGHVLVNKTDVKTFAEDAHGQPVTVARQKAMLFDDAPENTLTVEWFTAGWHAQVSVDYEQSADRGDARKAVQLLAANVVGLFAKYLGPR